MLLSIIV